MKTLTKERLSEISEQLKLAMMSLDEHERDALCDLEDHAEATIDLQATLSLLADEHNELVTRLETAQAELALRDRTNTARAEIALRIMATCNYEGGPEECVRMAIKCADIFIEEIAKGKP